MIWFGLALGLAVIALLIFVAGKLLKIELASSDNRSMLMIQDRINQLETQVTGQLNSVTGHVNERLKESTGLFASVQNSLGALQSNIKKIDEDYQKLTENITKFQNVLQPPAFRGGIGELMLEGLLKQIIPQDYFKLQYRFKSGKEVDAVMLLGDRLVCIDSKFPLDNFRKFIDTVNEDEKNKARKDFSRDIKNHIDSISSKYILPDEKTFDFAFMYIAAENVYYEVMVKPDSDGSQLLSYAHSKKVIPVSPNSFYAYLQSILMGLKGMQVNKKATEVMGNIMRLEGDLNKFKEDFRVLGNHVKNVKDRYDDAEKKLEKFSDKLSSTYHTGQLEDLSAGSDDKSAK